MRNRVGNKRGKRRAAPEVPTQSSFLTKSTRKIFLHHPLKSFSATLTGPARWRGGVDPVPQRLRVSQKEGSALSPNDDDAASEGSSDGSPSQRELQRPDRPSCALLLLSLRSRRLTLALEWTLLARWGSSACAKRRETGLSSHGSNSLSLFVRRRARALMRSGRSAGKFVRIALRRARGRVGVPVARVIELATQI